MNTGHAASERYDDVIFENRNKNYGAYLIRKEYDFNLSKGTLASFVFVASLFGIAYAAMMFGNRLDIAPMGPICKLPLPPPIIIKDPQIQKAQAPRTIAKANLPPLVVTKPIDPPPVEIPITIAPTGDGEGPPIDIGGEPVGIQNGVTAVPVVVEPPKTLDIAEVMPEFEGGSQAMYRFLRRTLRYPSASQRIGEEGIVFVRFVVDVTGSITGVEVIKGVSASLDKEASRVIGLMPKWKPGKQHGASVNVRMVLPIKFEIDKE